MQLYCVVTTIVICWYYKLVTMEFYEDTLLHRSPAVHMYVEGKILNNKESVCVSIHTIKHALQIDLHFIIIITVLNEWKLILA